MTKTKTRQVAITRGVPYKGVLYRVAAVSLDADEAHTQAAKMDADEVAFAARYFLNNSSPVDGSMPARWAIPLGRLVGTDIILRHGNKPQLNNLVLGIEGQVPTKRDDG